MKRTGVLVMSMLAFSGLALGAGAKPPETSKRPVEETVHGVKIVDEYRWLEGDNSDPANMGKVTDEVGKWTDAQNAHTRSVLDNLPNRKQIEEMLRPLMQIGSVSAPTMRGNYYFYTKREGKEKQPRVFVREGASGTPRLLIDPAAIDTSGLTALAGLFPSQDGKLLGYGTYRAGDENATITIIDTATGKALPDKIESKAHVIEWLPDASGFFYENLENHKDPYSAQIMFHKLGTPQSADVRLFRQYTKAQNEKLATTWGPGADVSRDGRWMVLTYWTGTSSNDIWAIDLSKWWKNGKVGEAPSATEAALKEASLKPIAVGKSATFGGTIEGDTLSMLTDYKGGNKSIIAVDLTKPDLTESGGAWKEVVPENKESVLTSFAIAKGPNGQPIYVGDYEEKAQSVIRLYDMAGKPVGKTGGLKLPGIGSAGVSAKEDRSEAFVSFTSFNYPATIFRVDLANPDAEPVVWERPDVPVDPSIVEVKQVFFSSKDGTQVPMFIVHKKGLKLDGNNPTILNGYGGFNISETPFFSATLFPWFEAGGVFANVNLRGGGEFGKAWHEGGMLDKKQNVFDDMIASAEYLISNGYTNPNKLGAIGGSNGGLLMGAMMTQRPDLFRAIVCSVPLLDMYRYQNFLMARYWVPEYGSAEEAKQFEYLQKYSPYHHIKPGTKYPAVLFTAGENDTRVHALHARKMAAAMQAATASDPAEKPVLLWVDRDAGHGAGKPLDLRIRDAADVRSFFMWQLGMLGNEKPK
jgi:prolyl oligopeptidase